MKIHIVTIGQPKLAYAKDGWQEYWRRLEHYHQIRVTHIADKHNDAEHLLEASRDSYRVALVIEGRQMTSPELAHFLDTHSQTGREVSFLIGGPEGLPDQVMASADAQWSLSKLTFPHDLAMLVLVETLYRASTINRGEPYHK